jgi:hypothetical protein
VIDAADVESPLKPEELQVLRAQYEKEGEYVGLQTKFNYAWVCENLECAAYQSFMTAIKMVLRPN